MKILILASNPRKDLNLDREIRDLRQVIEQSRDRREFEVEDALAVRVGDLQDLLFRHRPQIVHFCGHGSGAQGLVFEGNDGGEQWVRAEALSDLFRLFASNVGCVLLNACYSEEQANAIVNHIDYVIGMNQEIRDDAAIAFAKGFYRALGYARSLEESFEFGCNAIQLEISGSSKMRSGDTEQQRQAEVVDAIQQTVIPEHLKPILKTKPTLKSSQRSPIAPPEQSLSQATRVAIQLDINQALEADARVKQYRDRLREFLSDRKLSPLELIRLERLRKDLGLSPAEANQILAEEQESIRQAQDDYEAMLIGLIEADCYPFDAATRAELLAVRQELRLSAEEVEAIEAPILAAAEEDYQAKLVEGREQKLNRYQQEFRQAVAAHYPIASSTRNDLEQLQQFLGLSNEDVARIEEPLRKAAYQGQLKVSEFQVPTIGEHCKITYRQAQATYFVEDLGNGVTLEMVAVPGGSFIMGSTEFSDEHPPHRVTVPAFFIGKFVVTQAQWQAVAGLPKLNQILKPNPAQFKGSDRPVEQVNWHEAVEFCDRLSQKTDKPYRLPSEAEWEYACRAGTTTPFHYGETITPELANYDGNYTYGSGRKGIYRQQTTEVGSFPPNGFGLYDMHGNVWEWCADHWHENYQGAPIDGSAWSTGADSDRRLLRGGAWYYYPWHCRSAHRLRLVPDDKNDLIGFRVVCSAAWAL
jgi:formylglycine-generating enzyme required for sulfatase activity